MYFFSKSGILVALSIICNTNIVPKYYFCLIFFQYYTDIYLLHIVSVCMPICQYVSMPICQSLFYKNNFYWKKNINLYLFFFYSLYICSYLVQLQQTLLFGAFGLVCLVYSFLFSLILFWFGAFSRSSLIPLRLSALRFALRLQLSSCFYISVWYLFPY